MTFLSLVQNHRGLTEEFRQKNEEMSKKVAKAPSTSFQSFESLEDVEKVLLILLIPTFMLQFSSIVSDL